LLLVVGGSFYLPSIPFSIAQFAANTHGGHILDLTFQLYPGGGLPDSRGLWCFRARLLLVALLADLFFPLLYGLLLTAILRRLRPEAKKSRFLNYLPLLAGLRTAWKT